MKTATTRWPPVHCSVTSKAESVSRTRKPVVEESATDRGNRLVLIIYETEGGNLDARNRVAFVDCVTAEDLETMNLYPCHPQHARRCG